MSNDELVQKLREIHGMVSAGMVTELLKLCVTNPELLDMVADPLHAHTFNMEQLEYARFEADTILEKQLRAKIGYKIIELQHNNTEYTEI